MERELLMTDIILLIHYIHTQTSIKSKNIVGYSVKILSKF